jgi:hypothetical protein
VLFVLEVRKNEKDLLASQVVEESVGGAAIGPGEGLAPLPQIVPRGHAAFLLQPNQNVPAETLEDFSNFGRIHSGLLAALRVGRRSMWDGTIS